MELKEILGNLCYYDKRNPNTDLTDEEIDDHNKEHAKIKYCYCDNCYYGRTALALELLKYVTLN